MKYVSILFLPVLLLSGMACQKEDLSFTESTARITGITETGVGRNDGSNKDKFPYRINYDLTATLNDVSDVEEWGMYFVDSDTNEPLEFSFDEVSSKGVIHLYLNTISDLLHVGERTSYIEANRRMGLYIRKRGKKGDLKTYYGEMTSYKIRYEFPSTPSVEYSNPQLVSTEVIHVDEGDTASKRRYQTVYSYDLTVKGAFWIDYLEDVLSSGWSWNSESHYSVSDGTHSRSHTMTYDPGIVRFSQWVVIHCYDSARTIESGNWLNVSGDPSITKLEVSDYERNI